MADFTLATQVQPNQPNVGAMVNNANGLRQIQDQNALRSVLTTPGAIGRDGQPTSNALAEITKINPQIGASLQQNAIRMQGMKTEAFRQKLDLSHEVGNEALMMYESQVSGGMPEPAARRTAQQVYATGIEKLKQSGLFSEDETKQFNPQFDPNRLRANAMTYQQFKTMQEQQRRDTQTEKHQTTQEGLERDRIDAMKVGRDDTGWATVQTEQGPKRYNARTAQMTELDGSPIAGRPPQAPQTTAPGQPPRAQPDSNAPPSTVPQPVPLPAITGKIGAGAAPKPQEITVDGKHQQGLWSGGKWTNLDGTLIAGQVRLASSALADAKDARSGPKPQPVTVDGVRQDALWSDGKWVGIDGTPISGDVRLTSREASPGSAQWTREAIIGDIRKDSVLGKMSPGDQAKALEREIKIAQGTIGSDKDRENLASGIASYQIAPLSGFALSRPEGQAIMSDVRKFNPDYQEVRYPEVSRAMTAFGAGKQGDQTRFLNVGTQHLGTMSEAATALANGNAPLFNQMVQYYNKNTGASEPTTFDGLKHIVATEIQKAVAGGIGAQADREQLESSLSKANSPKQLSDVIQGYKSLMAGQLLGLKRQYEESTGFGPDSPFPFERKLEPSTKKELLPLIQRQINDTGKKDGLPANLAKIPNLRKNPDGTRFYDPAGKKMYDADGKEVTP